MWGLIIALIILGLLSFIFSEDYTIEEPKPKKRIPATGTHEYYCYIIKERIDSLKKTLKYSCKTYEGDFIEMWKDDKGESVVVRSHGYHTVSLYEKENCFGLYCEGDKGKSLFSWVFDPCYSDEKFKKVHYSNCKFSDWKRKYKVN